MHHSPPNLRDNAEAEISTEDHAAELDQRDARALVHELRVSQIELELQNEGLRPDAQAALKILGADPKAIDIVVTDFNMPGDSGLVLAEALRELRSDLPVVLTSAYVTEEPGQRRQRCGREDRAAKNRFHTPTRRAHQAADHACGLSAAADVDMAAERRVPTALECREHATLRATKPTASIKLRTVSAHDIANVERLVLAALLVSTTC